LTTIQLEDLKTLYPEVEKNSIYVKALLEKKFSKLFYDKEELKPLLENNNAIETYLENAISFLTGIGGKYEMLAGTLYRN